MKHIHLDRHSLERGFQLQAVAEFYSPGTAQSQERCHVTHRAASLCRVLLMLGCFLHVNTRDEPRIPPHLHISPVFRPSSRTILAVDAQFSGTPPIN